MKNAGRWIFRSLIGAALLAMIGFSMVMADAIPPPTFPQGLPPIPQRPEELKKEYKKADQFPGYSIGAGVVAITLSGSWIALRMIRKRNGQ